MRDLIALKSRILKMIIETSPPLVFKKGMMTDLTMGHLIEISSKETPEASDLWAKKVKLTSHSNWAKLSG